uniref:Uncharacterized protein n=1 Tax=Physcomitrium patens TaxID=3218 RepID=A0A2K1IVK0_PHYPA|nr:hypothetical protein PHYPA_025239 [Physcomitrium patens]
MHPCQRCHRAQIRASVDNRDGAMAIQHSTELQPPSPTPKVTTKTNQQTKKLLELSTFALSLSLSLCHFSACCCFFFFF